MEKRKGKVGGGDGWGNDYQMVFYYCAAATTTAAAASFKGKKPLGLTIYIQYIVIIPQKCGTTGVRKNSSASNEERVQ